ncbi:MAG: phenylalanine--tRNA ligase subunit alpha [Candidatus Thermoplasmatota archaeon]|jgi:phenylalanyl-tRNA synthetase alpha chain|nr:phenylalanine--tRNA ligase subunit alpha [Candidatus Thermoplasmatota archaeon]
MDLDKIIQELSQNEKKVLLTLKKFKGKAQPEEIFKNGDFNQEAEVMNASSWLQSKKLVTVEQHIKTVYSLGKEGKHFLEKGLPEKRALKFISDRNGRASLKDLSAVLDEQEKSVAVGWLKRNDWAIIKKEKDDTVLEITEKGKKALKTETEEEKILELLDKNPNIEVDKNKIKSLLSRKNIIREKEVVTSTVMLTNYGKKILEKGVSIEDEISQITSSVIKSGEWRNKTIRPYDIHAFAPAVYGGKAHPLVDLISKIRQIFIQMGFEEIEGDYVESCFWNMDMLFIPQDHPAREMQDTLYCKNPSRLKIKEKELVEKIAKVHEDGGGTSSTGWGYKFSTAESERVLLRTHTTVNTIRYLYNHPEPPCKVFSIGKVFRKESIDTTHLPEFYQIEGIVHEENTNFRQLIGVLKEFYNRMGFEKIRFRPGYFPYTEPSMEVDVFWNGKWMELGGSGIFRPEVTEPIGVKNPVLAWGLGLERLAMMKFGLDDIRKLYVSDLDWLRKKSLI